MILAEKVKVYSGTAVNLSSSPVTFSGLLGDTYDYYPVCFFANASGDSILDITLNADTTANYRNYEMKGLSSTASAAVGDSDTAIELQNLIGTANTSLFRAKITGSSGDERYIDSFYSADGAILKQSSYWKDTASEMTSITLTAASSVTCDYEIILYRTPKAASQAKWELMETLDWSAETSEKAFTVDGDRDIQYKISWEGDQELNLELNNDTTTYTRQYLQNAGGTISANNTTSATSIVSDGINSTFIINAEAGVKRLVTTSGSNTASAQQSERAHWYDDTATNLTSLDCTPTASTTGTAKLYRRINPTQTGDTLNFETVETVDISGDFSAGHTFSGLTGDSTTLYKVEFLGSYATGNPELRMQFNSDTGSNYVEQYLGAATSATTAAATTRAYVNLLLFDNVEQSSCEMYIYPNSGDSRPMLNKIQYRTDRLRLYANWYTPTVSEITSIKVFGSNSNVLNGTLKLSRLI